MWLYIDVSSFQEHEHGVIPSGVLQHQKHIINTWLKYKTALVAMILDDCMKMFGQWLKKKTDLNLKILIKAEDGWMNADCGTNCTMRNDWITSHRKPLVQDCDMATTSSTHWLSPEHIQQQNLTKRLVWTFRGQMMYTVQILLNTTCCLNIILNTFY